MDFLKSILFGLNSQSQSQEPSSQDKKQKPKKEDKPKQKTEKKPKPAKPKEYSYIFPPELLLFLDAERKQKKLTEGSQRATKILTMLDSKENRKPKRGTKTTENKKQKTDSTIEKIKLGFKDSNVHLTDKQKERAVNMWKIIATSDIDEKDKVYYREWFNKLKDKNGHIFIKANAPITSKQEPPKTAPKAKK